MGKFRHVPSFLSFFLPPFLLFYLFFSLLPSLYTFPCTNMYMYKYICTCVYIICMCPCHFLPSVLHRMRPDELQGWICVYGHHPPYPAFSVSLNSIFCRRQWRLSVRKNRDYCWFQKDWPSCATSGGRICLLNNASPISNSLRAYFEQPQNDGRWTYSSNREKQGGSLRGGHQKFDYTSGTIEKCCAASKAHCFQGLWSCILLRNEQGCILKTKHAGRGVRFQFPLPVTVLRVQ